MSKQSKATRTNKTRNRERAAEEASRHLSPKGDKHVIEVLANRAHGLIREDREAEQVPQYARSKKHNCLSSVTCKYLCTLANPSIAEEHIQPIPTTLPIPGPVSMRRFVARGTATHAATTDFGYVQFGPGAAGPYFNRNAVVATTATFAGAQTLSATDSPGAGQTDAVTWPPINRPFTPDANTGMEFRVTAAVLRIRNVSPAIYRGGSIVTLEAYSHEEGSFASKSFSALAGNKRARIFTAQQAADGWIEATWHPTTQKSDQGEYGLANYGGMNFTALTTSYTLNPAGELIIAFTGNGSGIPSPVYEWEAWAMYECIGSEVSGKREYNRDAEGMTAVEGAVSDEKASTGRMMHNRQSTMQKARAYLDAAAETARDVAEAGVSIVSLLGL